MNFFSSIFNAAATSPFAPSPSQGDDCRVAAPPVATPAATPLDRKLDLQIKAQAETGKLMGISFESQSMVDAYFKGRSAEEITVLREQYGAEAFDARFSQGSSDVRRWQRMGDEKMTEKMTETAKTLFMAVDGIGSDEGAISLALQGKSPDEIAEVKRIFSETYGVTLESRLAGDLSGDTMEEVKNLLATDNAGPEGKNARVAAAAYGLFNASWGVGTDESKIEDILRNIAPEEREAVNTKLKELTNGSAWNLGDEQGLDELIDDEFDLMDGEASENTAMHALAAGDTAKADAYLLDAAMNGGWNLFGTDEGAVVKILERVKTPEEMTALTERFKAEGFGFGDKSLAAHLEDELSGSELDEAKALIRAQNADPEVAKQGQLDVALARLDKAAGTKDVIGWGTDEALVWKQFEDKPPEECQAIVAAFNAKHGEGSFDRFIAGELEGPDLAKTRDLARQGKMDPKTALQFAVGNDIDGTDEDLIVDTLQDMSASELKALQETPEGLALLDRVRGETSGLTAYKIELALDTTKTPYQKAMEAYEYERNDGNWFVDIFSDSGEATDHQYSEMLTLNQALASNKDRELVMQAMDLEAGYLNGGLETYVDRKDQIAETAGGVVTTVAGLALTGGAANFLQWGKVAAAMFGTGVGGALGLGAEHLIKDEGFGMDYEDLALQVGSLGVDVGTAGLSQVDGVADFMGNIPGFGYINSLGPTAEGSIGREFSKGFGSTALGSIGGALFDEETYEKSAFGAIGDIGYGAFFDGLGGGFGNAGAEILGANFPGAAGASKKAKIIRKMIQDAAGGAVGSALAAGLNPATYADREENQVEGGGIPYIGDGVGNVSQSAAEPFNHWVK